jgi:hypothetical protein
MGSVAGYTAEDAIHAVWRGVLMRTFEAADFGGIVMIYDTVKRERVYYFHE